MATVLPFHALRYNPLKAGDPEGLCCPPYDIISDTDTWLNRSEYNVVRLEKPEGANAYQRAAETLADWKRAGVLARDEDAAFYRYEIEFDDAGELKTFSGVLAHVELRPYADGVVLPHENTLAKAKADRYELMMATGCHFSPVYSLYRDGEGKVAALTAQGRAPDVEVNVDGAVHRLWRIADPAVCGAITEAFADKSLYIADGHHRYETSLKVRQELGDAVSPNVMMMLVDMNDPGLVVFPTHRVVSGLERFDAMKALETLSDTFWVEKCSTLAPNAVVMLTKDCAYRLTLKDDSFDGLDVTLLHDYILEPLFGINAANMADQKNLGYTRDADEARRAVESGEAQCAFLLNPTRVGQIAAVADAGGKMPQKSTYFYPKLITGLVINEFKEA